MNQDQNNINGNNYNTQNNEGVFNNKQVQDSGEDANINNNRFDPYAQQNLNIGNSLLDNQFTTDVNNQNIKQQKSNEKIHNGKFFQRNKVGLIMGLLSVIIIVFLAIFIGRKDDLQDSAKKTIIKEKTQDFYVISSSQEKGKLAMSSDFKTQQVTGYNLIEKYNMKWVTERKLFIVSIPIIPNRTKELNSYYEGYTSMESEILDITYDVYDQNQFNGTKTEVEKLFQHSMEVYNSNPVYTLDKKTDIVENNGIFSYAFSINTIYSKRIDIYYYLKLDNQLSNQNYYLTSFISFDIDDYDSAKSIIEELSKTVNYNLINLVEQVK